MTYFAKLIKKVWMIEPKPKQIDHSLITHNDLRIDPFYWMNQRDDPDVLSYLQNENDYARVYFEKYSSLQDELFQEILSRIPANEDAAPYFDNGYWYFKKFKEGFEYPEYFRGEDLNGTNLKSVLNVNILAQEFVFFHLGEFKISPNNKLVAYTFDTQSRRIYTIRIVNLENQETISELTVSAGQDLEWSSDSNFLYYTTKDSTLRECCVWRHRLNSEFSNDVKIYEEIDDAFYVGLNISKSSKYLLIESVSAVESNIRYLPLKSPVSEPVLFIEGKEHLEYYIDHLIDIWVIRTNLDGINFSIKTVAIENTAIENWITVVPHSNDILIEEFELIDDKIVVLERSSAIPRIRIIYNNNSSIYVPFNEEAYSVDFYKNLVPSSNFLYLIFSSPRTPKIVYKYSLDTGNLEVFWKQIIPGRFNSDNYLVERKYVMSHDEQLIPITIIYSKMSPPNPDSPLLLYGYGSYGISIDPGFTIPRLSLLDRGFVFVIAHIRGGQELGRNWYENGKFLKKKNTFLDFISCAEFLLHENYTSPHNLFAYGGSAGGMLMGYIMNEYPQLWKGVIAVVPFVDVLTTMLDESIPLTTGEFDEWGNPKDYEYYHYMNSYSPYDNIKDQEYPNTYIRTGYHDSQVQYWEPAKWTAKLRLHHQGDQIILFECDMDSGHGGASGRFKQYKEISRDYTFLLSLLDKMDND